MNSRRVRMGLVAVCALLISAIAASAAMANKEDTTTYTCSSTATTKTFGDADCTTAGTGFGHTAIPVNTRTELTGTAGTTVLKSTLAGVTVILTSTSAEPAATGVANNWVENRAEGTEMWTEGEGKITYKGVTENHGCEVEGLLEPGKGTKGMISTSQLKATTKGATLTTGEKRMALKFTPKEGATFAEFNLVGAACPAALIALNPYKVNGSTTGQPSGSNVVFTHTQSTAQESLTVLGKPAGIEGSLTLSGRASGSTGAFTPLSVTTE